MGPTLLCGLTVPRCEGHRLWHWCRQIWCSCTRRLQRVASRRHRYFDALARRRSLNACAAFSRQSVWTTQYEYRLCDSQTRRLRDAGRDPTLPLVQLHDQLPRARQSVWRALPHAHDAQRHHGSPLRGRGTCWRPPCRVEDQIRGADTHVGPGARARRIRARVNILATAPRTITSITLSDDETFMDSLPSWNPTPCSMHMVMEIYGVRGCVAGIAAGA